MRRGLSLALLPLLWLTAGADARLTPSSAPPPDVSAAPDREIWRYTCDVEQQLAGGTVNLTRLFDDDGKFDGGDFMRWNPKGHDPQKTQRPLDLELSYIWEPARQPAVEPREIEVKLRVGIDTDLPEVALLHIQRPFPVQPRGIIGSTGLSTQVFPYGRYDLKNGHGELPLGDLLAYADGYDTLGWTLIQPSDRLGGGKDLARGTIDITALREAVAALPALRTALAAKTVSPKQHCEHVMWPARILY